ncbi:MAG: dependent oxidoreductase, partial [Nocardioides sp.]|nr:dependent oxidoreductase [Nocardioides sp.]
MSTEHVDVLIVGAGLSGIGAACRLRTQHPGRSVALLEGRSVSGGTWDLFRYPGVRSDSDMYTLGYQWRPWAGDRALADGPSILAYVRDVAEEYGVDRLIRYDHRVLGASWDSATALWTVDVEHAGTHRQLTTGFLWGCSGYYDYDQGYAPEFPGQDAFAGRIVHPQHWPEDLDHTGKRVVVIGSGATAVTLVPAMADDAAQVTMLQRSPTYVLSMPARDPVATKLARLPAKLSFPIIRWKSILVAMASYQLSRKRPDVLRGFIRKNTIKQ